MAPQLFLLPRRVVDPELVRAVEHPPTDPDPLGWLSRTSRGSRGELRATAQEVKARAAVHLAHPALYLDRPQAHDLALDAVGGETMRRGLGVIKPGGRLACMVDLPPTGEAEAR